VILAGAALALALTGGPARAQDGLPPMHVGQGLLGVLSEVRFGAMAHGIVNKKEQSVDLNAELLFVSPVPERWLEGTPNSVRWLLQPRPHIGVSPNLGGFTNKGYFGLTWTTLLARDLLRPGDGLRFDFLFGGSLNDGRHAARFDEPKRLSLGGNLLFHLGAEIGYQITPRYSVSIFYDHDSNADLASHNQGLNSLGLRFGIGL
jgi:lipid A 3-O-deacylase